MADPVSAFISVGKFVTFGKATGAVAGVIGFAATVATAGIAMRLAMRMPDVQMPAGDSDRRRQDTQKTTTGAFKVVYGQALVSGPIVFVGTSGLDNQDLYYAIAVAGHEVEGITDIHFDDVVIENDDIGGGAATGGAVGSGSTIFGPKGGSTIVTINKHVGTATQASDSMLTSTFTGWTAAHQGKGIAYIVTKWSLTADSRETFDQYTPNNIKAIVKGKKIYDPRLEVTAGGTAGASPTNASYIAWSDNPALCLADYLMDDEVGLGVASTKIDWAAIITAADGCDVSVTIPGGSEKRFTCNGVVFGTDTHRVNIEKILSSCNGNLSYTNGVFVLRAGIYEAPTVALTADDLMAGMSIQTSFNRGDRFNTVKGIFIDPAQNHTEAEFPSVQLAGALSRDNNQVLEKEVALNMTNTSTMAQRIANKLIQVGDLQQLVTFPANLSALRVAIGDRVTVTVEELSWSSKVFQCVNWSFSEGGGVNLTLREDSSTAYADPASGDYSTLTATGAITSAFRGVPDPSGLTATAGLKNVELDWVNPSDLESFSTIHVLASASSAFSGAQKIGETTGTQFVHDAANGVDPISPGDTRYYWVRAIKYVGTSDEARSSLQPNADPNTTVFATCGRVNWSDVSGTTGAPQDNATVGATIGTNLLNSDDTTAENFVNPEAEDGTSLQLEDDTLVDLQTLDNNTVATMVTVDGLSSQYSVKVDANGRVAGFGLASTLIDDTPVSAFSVLADKFSIVNPSSSEDDPIIPFTVSADKIHMGTDVAISGDLITSGTVSADRLDVSGLITAGSLVVTSAVNDNVTAISGDVITTGTVSTDRLDVSSLITAGSLVVTSAVNDNVTAISGDVITTGTVSTDRLDVAGLITAGNLVITSAVNDNVTAISGDVITTGTVSADRLDVAGLITAGSLVVTGANISTLTNNSGFVDATGAASAAPVQSVAGETGAVSASTIASAAPVQSVAGATGAVSVSTIISAGSIVAQGDNISTLTNNSGFVDAAGAASAAPVQSVAGATGAVSASTIISAGSIVVQGDNVSTLNNDSAFINAGQVDGSITAINGGTITTGTINANRINIDGVTLDTDSSNQLIIKASGVDSPQIKENALGTIIGDTSFDQSATQFTAAYTEFIGSTPYHYDPGGSQPFLDLLAEVTFTTPLTTSDTIEYVVTMEGKASGSFSSTSVTMITTHVQRTNALGDSYDIDGTRTGDDNEYGFHFTIGSSAFGLLRIPIIKTLRGGSTVYLKLYGYQKNVSSTQQWDWNFISAEALSR